MKLTNLLTITWRFECEGPDVYALGFQSGTRSFTHSCSDSCVTLPSGVKCGTSTSRAYAPASDVAPVRLEVRDEEAVEDRHWVCSDDRSAVLICRWGFCSIDYYCTKRGTTCQDMCVCCKKGGFAVGGVEGGVLLGERRGLGREQVCQ